VLAASDLLLLIFLTHYLLVITCFQYYLETEELVGARGAPSSAQGTYIMILCHIFFYFNIIFCITLGARRQALKALILYFYIIFLLYFYVIFSIIFCITRGARRQALKAL